MKKIIFAVLALLMVSASAFAVTLSKTVKNVSSTVAACDGAAGYCADVDSDGAVEVAEKLSSAVYETGDDATSVDAAAVVKAIIFTGDTAGDYVLIKDDTTTYFDISVGTAKDTIVVPIPGGVSFATDVAVDMTVTSAGRCTIIYN